MQLKDMKLHRDGKSEEAVVIAMSEVPYGDESRESYPYGLRLTLDKDALEKLGVKASGFEPGKAYKLVARAEVESVSIHKSNSGRGYSGSNVELQIIEMGLEPMDDFGSAWEEAMES